MKVTDWPANRIAHYLTQHPETHKWHVHLQHPDGRVEEAAVADTIADANIKASLFVNLNYGGKSL